MLTGHGEVGMKSLSENGGKWPDKVQTVIRHLGSRDNVNAVAFKADGLSGNDFAALARFNNTVDLH